MSQMPIFQVASLQLLCFQASHTVEKLAMMKLRAEEFADKNESQHPGIIM
jgi:hypothetical protein